MSFIHLKTSLPTLILLVISSHVVSGQDRLPIMTLPANRTVRAGDAVLLPCILRESDFCTVYWYRMDLQTYFTKNGARMRGIPELAGERYEIVGDTSIGDFTLRISNATAWDAGKYQCACYATVYSNSYTSPPAVVRVLVAPPEEYPQCELRKKHGLLLPGDEVELLCTSNGGLPGVQLQWFDGEMGLTSETSWNQMTIARHKTMVLPGKNLSNYYCKASGEALVSPRNCSVEPVAVATLPPVKMDSNMPADWHDIQGETAPLTEGQQTSQDMIELSFTCGPSVNLTREVSNFTWYVNSDPVRPGTFGFLLENNGRTLRVTDLSILHSSVDVEIVCELTNNGWAIANSSTVVSLGGNAIAPPTESGPTTGPFRIKPEEPDIFVHKHPKKRRMWPIWLLIICVLMSLFLLILLAIYAPVMCGCKKKAKQAHSHCRHTTTKSGTRISEFHYTHSQGCSTLRTSSDTLNVYELPDSERGVPDQQRQQVQATLHVVVHSANHSANHAVSEQPVISTAETIVSSDYGTENCLATSSPQAVSNYYHPDLSHYQKVRPGARPANSISSVPASPKPQPPQRKDSLEPHYQHPRSHNCCLNQTWGHNVRHGKPVCRLAPAALSSQPDVTEGCYIRTLPHPPNEVKQAKLVYVEGGARDHNGNGNVCAELPLDDPDNIYENIAGEDDHVNKHTLV